MAIDKSKLTKLSALEALAQRTKSEITKTNEKVDGLSQRVDNLVTAGGEPNVITAVKVNGTAQTITDKAVDIAVPVNVSQLANDSKYQTEEQVAAAIAAMDHLQRKKVASKDDIDPTATDADKYIYMVPKTGGQNGDKYDEYMVLDGAIEPVGDWAVDLSGYQEKQEGAGLYPDADKEKLAGMMIATDAEVAEVLDAVFSAAE